MEGLEVPIVSSLGSSQWDLLGDAIHSPEQHTTLYLETCPYDLHGVQDAIMVFVNDGAPKFQQ